MRSLLFTFVLVCLAPCAGAKILSDTPQVSIFPNPNTGVFTISIQAASPVTVFTQVFNSLGIIFREDSSALHTGTNNIQVDLRNAAAFKAGVYYVALTFSNKIKTSYRVVVNPEKPSRADSIDVLHYSLNLTIRNLASKTISGFAVLAIKSLTDSLATIRLDLLKLHVTRVMMDSSDVPYAQNDSELYVTLNRKTRTDSVFQLHIAYNGQPVTDAQWGGFYFNGNYAYNLGVGFKSDPHTFGRCWFPCVDNFTDRATYSFITTTDSGWKAVSNGLPEEETTNPDGSKTWRWELTEPIPTYLASVAVGQYVFVKHPFAGLKGNTPVWIAVEEKDTTKAKLSFARLDNALQCFEEKFGPYPFGRVGYVGVPFNSGAMEHATNIAYPLYAINGSTANETLYAHELSHMWWGDHATCRTAGDMWLNEGWASFCEALFLECAYGKSAYDQDILSKHTEVMKNAATDDGGFQPVSGINTTITYGTHVYKKGALVVHSLRTVMGDAAFFAACKSYQVKNGFKDVSSEDLRQEFQKFTPADLTDFFAHWVYEKGFADVVVSDLKVMIGNATNFVDLKLEQRYRYASGYHKLLPVTINVYSTKMELRQFPVLMTSPVLDTMLGVTFDFIPAFVTVNEDMRLALGHTHDKISIRTTGSQTLSNTLLSLNVQSITDSASLYAEHHWTEPTQGNISKKGIRISPERYWRITGIIPGNFTSWAFFAYDGTSGNYLDKELLSGMASEDSIVLLYRPSPGADWQVHTDNTLQAGNKTDKTGRFWVNRLQAGDYAFGIRDQHVTGLGEARAEKNTANLLSVYPNPAQGSVTIDLRRLPDAAYRVSIFSISGQLIKTCPAGTIIPLSIDTDSWAKGNYTLVLEGGAQKISRIFTIR